jgi:putative FmdB family regulatory protein
MSPGGENALGENKTTHRLKGEMPMPIYEYRCTDCSKEFEKIVTTPEKEPVRCPYCKGDKVIRILSAFARGGGKGASAPATCGPSSAGFS